MMGDSHIRIGASMARPPWTVLIPVALAFLLPLVQLWPQLAGDQRFRHHFGPEVYPALRMLLSLTAGWVVAALLARGLWRGSRFVQIAAVVWWLVVEAGWGGYLLLVSGGNWAEVSSYTEHGFFQGALPIAVGLVAAILLLLPASWRWTHHRGLARP